MHRTALAASLPLVLTAALSAHGGQYRGPGSPIGPPPPGGGPAPTVPGSGTPNTGAGASIPDEVSWQLWWEFHKEPYLLEETGRARTAVTGSDDFYLGQRKGVPPVDVLAPTEADLTDRIVPTLAKLLREQGNRDIQTACLIALGKVGRDAPGIALEPLLAGFVSRADQEVRETAVLSLGIAGRPAAAPLLIGLLRDDADGRKLAGRAEVDDRTRAFAAYGLGLLARRLDDSRLAQQAHDALWAVLQDERIRNRDLRTAVVTGLGLLTDPATGRHKRLAWQTTDELLAWYQRDLGKGDEAVQAHAPVAIARLLGRGSSDLHQRCKEHFTAVLGASSPRGNPILQSAALALGALAVPPESLPPEARAVDAAASAVLQKHFEHGVDRLARYFSVAALGHIGGEANREWLLSAYNRANRNTGRLWVALALGLLANRTAREQGVDEATAQILLADLPDARKPEGMGAHAVALGLTRHAAAMPVVQRLLLENEHDETLAGYLCISLALLSDRAATKTLTEVLERSRRRPFLLQQAAIGLGRLGDRAVTPLLLKMLEQSQSVAALAAVAGAIGRIGDRRAIEPLIELAGNEELTKLARAFVAAALGGVGDKDPLPWNLPIARGCNYAAPVDTLTNGSTGVLDIL